MLKRLTVAVVAVLFLSACGDDSPTAPSVAQLGGNWTGNMQSSNWVPVAVNLGLTQVSDNVTGTWAAPANDWNGTISGNASRTQFTGTFTITAPNTGGGARCTGTASVSGPVSTSATSVTWTSPGFTGSCNGMPINLTWNLQR